jgi:hypothetical protein
LTNFSGRANAELVAWKRRTPSLTDRNLPASPYGPATHGPAYDVCLPQSLATYDLLPEARALAVERFERLGIHWHNGTTVAPSNHLRSSQVQCVNALMPFVDDPASLKTLFESVLPIDKVVPFGDPGAPDDYVVFEWVGLHDYLHEGNGKPRTRGANATSVDAAIRYRTPSGDIEIGLIEWKYTESYPLTQIDPADPKNVTRRKRYESLWEAVVRSDQFELHDFFAEPVYQLFRQQMLAHEMEKAHELHAAKVRVVYAAPGANAALWSSIPTNKLRTLVLPSSGEPTTDLRELWDALRLEEDRFMWFDTAALVAPDAPTSAEFKDRYGHLAPIAVAS